MQTYIGVKLINAKPMNRQEYNDFRGWTLPNDEDGSDEGFLVEYVDGGKANTEQYAGYVSWSPKSVFENAYRDIDGMSFGLAVELLKRGAEVARSGWNGKGMWLALIGTGDYQIEEGALYGYENSLLPWIGMKTVDNKFVPWLASQTDILADDWVVVEL